MAREYKIISGDTHMEVAPERWTVRVPERYRDRAPRRVRLSNGADGMLVEGNPIRENAFDLYGGKGRDNWGPFGQTYESTPGTASAEDRLKCLDLDGMDAEVIFPAVATGPRLWRSIRDDDAYRACIRAYNDFIAEEYIAYAPDRFIPMATMPAINVRETIEEMQRCLDLGFRGITLQSFPSGKGYPTADDDEFWQEVLTMKAPVTVHVDIPKGDGPYIEYKKRSGPADIAQQVARFAQRGAVNAVQLLMSGVFDRFPELRIFYAENQIGWVPTFMTVADERYNRHIAWAEKLLDFQPLQNGMPSDYIRRHSLWGFQRDPAGVELRHWMGVENLIWGSDFPHQESEYPHSMKVVEENFRNVPEDEKYKMTCGNVIDFFHLVQPVEARASATVSG